MRVDIFKPCSLFALNYSLLPFDFQPGTMRPQQTVHTVLPWSNLVLIRVKLEFNGTITHSEPFPLVGHSLIFHMCMDIQSRRHSVAGPCSLPDPTERWTLHSL